MTAGERRREYGNGKKGPLRGPDFDMTESVSKVRKVRKDLVAPHVMDEARLILALKGMRAEVVAQALNEIGSHAGAV